MVKAPLVGTFYSASAPEEEPFVQVGDSVKKGQDAGDYRGDEADE